ncbi:MAG: hypothetical protein ABWY13_01250 [Mesorhizobium sp.]|jgi:hypothetical protein
MTTELEPPAPLPIQSRAGWFNAGHTSGAIFAAKLMQSAEPLSQLEQKMDAYEFFHQIVEPNCENALRPPYHLRLAWNAIVSLNTVPEFIVLHRLGYKTDVDRDLLYREIEEIRKKYPALTQLNNEAIKLKHVRRLPRKENEPLSSINSSTSHVISEPTLAELLETIHDAFQTMKAFPELSPINRSV